MFNPKQNFKAGVVHPIVSGYFAVRVETKTVSREEREVCKGKTAFSDFVPFAFFARHLKTQPQRTQPLENFRDPAQSTLLRPGTGALWLLRKPG